jgi:hypothetical protein
MADDKSPFEKSGSSAFADGAARFDALAKELKTQQIARIGGASSLTYRPPAVSPDETWARNYMTQSIGPQLEMPRMASITLPPMPDVSLDFAPAEVVPPKPDVARTGEVGTERVPLDVSQPIGTRLGRPEPRRSWLGRLLRGKSQNAQ